MRVGVVGIGVMGGGMTLRLLASGHEVSVYDLRPEPFLPLVERGALRASSAAEAAEGRQFVITSLPQGEDVRSAITGNKGILAGLASDAVIVETSTVSPEVVLELAPLVREGGADIVDAPVVTSQKTDRRPIPPEAEAVAHYSQRAAIAGNLCFLVGGELKTVEMLAPLFEVLGIEYNHMGPLGTGAALKLIINAILGTELALLSEMMVLARKAGMDLKHVVNVLQGTSANSVPLQNDIAKFTVNDYFPDGLFPVDYMVKDLGLALGMAKQYGARCDVTSIAHGLFMKASRAGYGNVYSPAVIRAIEKEDQ